MISLREMFLVEGPKPGSRLGLWPWKRIPPEKISTGAGNLARETSASGDIFYVSKTVPKPKEMPPGSARAKWNAMSPDERSDHKDNWNMGAGRRAGRPADEYIIADVFVSDDERNSHSKFIVDVHVFTGNKRGRYYSEFDEDGDLIHQFDIIHFEKGFSTEEAAIAHAKKMCDWLDQKTPAELMAYKRNQLGMSKFPVK